MATTKKPRRAPRKKKSSTLKFSPNPADITVSPAQPGDTLFSVSHEGKEVFSVKAPDKPNNDLMAKTIDRVATRLSTVPEALVKCLNSLEIPATDKGLEKIKSGAISRDTLIQHFKTWAWPGTPPTQAQILGAIIMFEAARPDDLPAKTGPSDEILALSECWDAPDLGADMRERVGLIDATMIKVKTASEGTDQAFNEARKREVELKEDLPDGDGVLGAQQPAHVREVRRFIPRENTFGIQDGVYETPRQPVKNFSKYLHRINAAAQILQEKPEDIQTMLEAEGISLDTLDVTSSADLTGLLSSKSKSFIDPGKLLSAVKALKGKVLDGDFQSTELSGAFNDKPSLIQAPEQMDDRTLLERYVKGTKPMLGPSGWPYKDVAWELERRAKGQPFIVLTGKGERGSEEIDVDTSFHLLRASRRKTNPPAMEDGRQVYTVRDMDLDVRTVDLCSVCGDALYSGWCEKCRIYTETTKRVIIPRPARLPAGHKVEVLVQVNGKACGSLQVRPGASIDVLERDGLRLARDLNAIGDGVEPRKVVMIPDKIVNLLL